MICLGVREEIGSKDWKSMSELLGKTSAGNDGFIGFFYDDHEILPQNIQGRFYFGRLNEAAIFHRGVFQRGRVRKHICMGIYRCQIVRDVCQLL